jgi:PAS domain S-box-containing protein
MSDFLPTSAHWRSIAENAPELILIIDPQARIRYLNYTLLDYKRDEVIGRSVYDFVPPRFHEQMRDCYRQVLETGRAGSYEVEYAAIGGERFWYNTLVGPLSVDGDTIGLTLCVRDVTSIKQTQLELAQQKSILAAIIDSMADGVAVVDEKGKFLVYNRAADRIVGLPRPDELSADEWQGHFGLFRADKETPFPNEELPLQRAARGEKQQEVEIFIRNRSQPAGIFVSVNAAPVTDEQGRHHGGVAVFRDITESRQAAERLRAEEMLLRRLLELQESDRKVVAHEIHDGFVQDVVGAQMQLETARYRIGHDPTGAAQSLQEAARLLRKAIAEGRRMISNLRPLVIDERGIVEALKHLIADQEAEAGLVVRLDCDPQVGQLDPRVEGTLFRIVQEALNNVKYHSRATQASVSLRKVGRMLLLEVRDNGVGFDPERVSPSRFGLRSICERARLFGGSGVIESSPGGGTVVRVELSTEPVVDD